MARIRTIKPEFWTDETIVELDFADRLLFIGLWNFADDQGYLPLRPKRIKMQVFPGDDYDVLGGLRRLWESSLVSLYASPDGTLLHIRNWSRHQKISNPAREKYSPSDLRVLGEWATDGQSPLETYPAERKGREGKGKERISSAPADADAGSSRFEDFWNAYGKKVDRKRAEDKWRLALKKPGVTAERLIESARRYVAWERANNEGGRFIMDPARWLHGERWHDERPAAPTSVRVLPNAADLELPPDGLTPQEYAEWERGQRAKRAAR